MNVKLILSADRKMCSFAPADEENNPTLILMIGCASERSVRKTIARQGHTITQIIDQGTPLGSLVIAMGWPAQIISDQVQVIVPDHRVGEYMNRAIRWREENSIYTLMFHKQLVRNGHTTIKVTPFIYVGND